MENKRQIPINGKKVEVSEDVYRAYMREEWREAQRDCRAKKCRNADGTVCRQDCTTCAH